MIGWSCEKGARNRFLDILPTKLFLAFQYVGFKSAHLTVSNSGQVIFHFTEPNTLAKEEVNATLGGFGRCQVRATIDDHDHRDGRVLLVQLL